MSVARSVSTAGTARLFAPFGVEVRAHWLFLPWLALCAFELGMVLALLFNGLLFGSVLLHELGHCLGARAIGRGNSGIVLYPFGGASLLHAARSAREELVATAAGPAVTLGLAAGGFGVAALTGGRAPDMGDLPAALGGAGGPGALAMWLGLINGALFVFNAVPAFPMDGGRLLRAGLWLAVGWRAATFVATVLALLLAAVTLVVAVLLGHLYLILVGLFVGVASWAELQRARATPPGGQPGGAPAEPDPD